MIQPIDPKFRLGSAHFFARLHKECRSIDASSRLGIIKLYGTAQDSALNYVGVEACKLHVYICL